MMGLIAKFSASEVVKHGGGRIVPCGPDDEGAREVDEYGNTLYGGLPVWFKAEGVTHVRYDSNCQGAETVKLTAVADADGTNKTWAEATPSGTIEMRIQNPEVFGYIEPGQAYYVEIRKVQPSKARR